MKRKLMAALLVFAMVAALVIPASATEENSGFYGIGTATNLTIEPNGTLADGVYVDSDRLAVTYTAAKAGCEYLVLLVSGTELPTASDTIRYIDQKTAESTTVAFNVYPALSGTEDMTLFLTSNDPDFTTISVPVSYHSAKPLYTRGDVDGENGINSYDASLILQYLVGTYEFVDNGALAADVDGENGINSYDASLILQYLVGTYEIDN